jgi:hypothetical protein
MLRRCDVRHFKQPRNLGVAPRFDSWNEKYEAWGQLRRMARLAGTGFYIPPAWYQHFRMFPPANHNFTEEKTQNPFNQAEDTQADLSQTQTQRDALRRELGEKSRSLASEGMRYSNLFWVKKPIDEMERHYYLLTRGKGRRHDEAVRAVLQQYRERQTVRKRVHLIQAEEAKLSGGFITMKEAMSVLNVLSTIQTAKMAPYQYAEMTKKMEGVVLDAPLKTAAMVSKQRPKQQQPAAAADAAAAAAGAGSSVSLLAGDAAAETAMELFESLEVADEPLGRQGVAGLREAAMDGTADGAWYAGAAPTPPRAA